MLTTEKLAEVRKLRDYCDAVLTAHLVMAEPEPEKPAEPDLVAWKTSQANRILASAPDSAKAELFGTLSTPPAVTAKAITDLDCYPSLADAVVGFGAEARAWALAKIDAKPELAAEPLEDVKP